MSLSSSTRGGVCIRGLAVDPPLANGSGVVDINAPNIQYRAPAIHVSRLGMYVTKTITIEAREGNPQPRVAPWPHGGLVNSVGLQNPGVDDVIIRWSDDLAALKIPVIASVAGDAESIRAVVERIELSAMPVDGYELNLSCPNVGSNGLQAADPGAVQAIVAAIRAVTDRPVMAKLTPMCSSITECGRAAQDAGADAVTAINTVPVRAVHADRQLLGSINGGVSGPTVHAMALRCVNDLANAIDIPVIGIGGVDSTDTATAMFTAGASIVGIGTAAAFNPTIIDLLADELTSSTDMVATGVVRAGSR